MRGISCRLSPIPDHAFFEQAVLEGQVGHDLLQGGGLPTQVLHLVRRGSPRRVAGEPLLARLQEVLRPAIKYIDEAMPSWRHSSAKLSSPRRPSSTMQIFSSAENCRRVARRRSFTTASAGCFTGPDFCFIFASGFCWGCLPSLRIDLGF